LKRLANHKTTTDVTAGYIIADVERLRQPMQKITVAIKLYANIRDGHDDDVKERMLDLAGANKQDQ